MSRASWWAAVCVAVFAACGGEHAKPEPVCCGCLCSDARWSCSQDTCTDAKGAVTELAPEAGFMEIELGRAYDAAPPLSGSTRMWYAFRPADREPEKAPLMIIYQGGPGSPMFTLWGGNTGPITVDPDHTGSGTFAPNPFSWTRFANLLYVETPVAGYSYYVDRNAIQPNDADQESAAYVRVLLRFLTHHPRLAKVPVVMVGESYGGARANRMFQQLLHYPALRNADDRFYDPALADEIEAYLRRAHGDADATYTPEQVADTFVAQVLIQGLTVMPFSFTHSVGDAVPMPPQPDTLGKDQTLMARVTDLPTLRELAGVDIDSIAWLRPEARSNAFSCTTQPILHQDLDPAQDSPSLVAAFGALGADDFYYYPACVVSGFSTAIANSDDDQRFVDTLRYIDTFETNAVHDWILPTRDMLLSDLPKVAGIAGTSARALDATTEDVDVLYADGTTRTVRLPRYDEAYHPVSLYEPGKLADDMERWLSERGYVR